MTPTPRLLIAEDDPSFRRVIGFTFERRGWQIESVGDGRQAWETFSAREFDFLITDFQMPGLTGVELIDRIRSAGNRRVQIVLCTAKGLEFDTESLLQKYHLLRVLHKPFSPRTLADMLVKQSVQDGFIANTAMLEMTQ